MIHIFLPAYNEAVALPRVTEKFSRELAKRGDPFRFIVLDDGSSDGTARTAEELAKRFPLELLRHPVNLGLGPTLKDGIAHLARVTADDDLVVMLDCDDTHEPEFLPAALDKIKEGYDVVLLSRFCPGGGCGDLDPFKKFLSMGAGTFLKIFFPIKGVKEYSCCYRVFRASILKKGVKAFGDHFIRLPHLGFVAAPEILVRMRMLGARIVESPFTLRYDQKPGKSKHRRMKTVLGYFALAAIYFGKKT